MWTSLKAQTDKIWVLVAYVKCDPRKHEWEQSHKRKEDQNSSSLSRSCCAQLELSSSENPVKGTKCFSERATGKITEYLFTCSRPHLLHTHTHTLTLLLWAQQAPAEAGEKTKIESLRWVPVAHID
jgi:hypothetical protein